MKHIAPRLYQIAALAVLLTYGVTRLAFDVSATRILLTLAIASADEWVRSRVARIPFDPKSAAIPALSLSLLLRSNGFFFIAVAAVVAIASKFVLRWNGKHVFNPTCFAIVLLLATTDRVWVSPGQWGNVAFFGFLITCIGGLVVNRASRSDVTYAFIASWALALFGRPLWLGETMTVPLHPLPSAPPPR